MVGGDVNPYPILLLVNYWELRASAVNSRLDDLVRKGVTQFATFVPWQVAEADISHSLTRFLVAAAERNLRVFLILSPEVGLHYQHSGLPKDVMSKKENCAQHSNGGRIHISLPPQSYSLPSFLAPEFSKRYYGFLSRMDGQMADLAKYHPQAVKKVSLILTGSFWKYYRSPIAASHSAFSGNAGDYCSHAALAFRQRLESHFAQKEFMDPTPASANRWKTRLLEEVNRRWFYQQSEDVFRSRSSQLVRKKAAAGVAEIELYTPEADPSFCFSNFLQMMASGHSDFAKLSKYIEEAASRISFTSSNPCSSFIHWTSMGGFHLLAESEKQFLVLKSLLMLASQGGGILMEESEWFSLSANFRSKAEALARSIHSNELTMRNKIHYLTPHLWSSQGILWEELSRQAGPGVKVVTTMDLVLKERSSQLLVVDPTFILTKELIQKLTAWAKGGRVLVLPRSQLYTESARAELEQVLGQTKKLELDLGLSYRLHSLGDGKIIIYDAPDLLSSKGEPLASWQNFLKSVLSLAEVDLYAKVSDSRLFTLALEQKDEGLALFVLNGTRKPIPADIVFSCEVSIGDLGSVLARSELGLDQKEKQKSVPQSTRFSLDVPPFGVLPLSVDGLKLSESKEKQIAALTSEETRRNVLLAAASELPGFSEGIEEIWN